MQRSGLIADLAEDLRGKRILLAGGTGSIGQTLLGVILGINRETGAGIRACIMSRRTQGFFNGSPELVAPGVEWLQADACRLNCAPESFDFVIHAATETGPNVATNPAYHFTQTIRSTESMLQYAMDCRAKGFLLLSSGAIYGPQPRDLDALLETYGGGPDPLDPASAYGQSKRAAEQLCCLFSRANGLPVKIARIFSFVGEHVPLDAQLAVGNFLRDALVRDAIQVAGDGRPVRTYLWGEDLALWLLRILTAGRPGVAYNVGSDVPVSLLELAQLVAHTVSPGKLVCVAGATDSAAQRSRYVPSIERAKEELGLEVWTQLSEALARTAEALRKQGGRSSHLSY